MAKQNTAQTVRELLEKTITDMGYMLWDVEYVKTASDWRLIITIDNEDGITIDDCEKVHRTIDPILDDADPIENSYRLEVSSPGIERELRTDEHIYFCLGMPVSAKLFAPVNGKKTYEGILAGYDGDTITIALSDSESIGLLHSAVSKLSTLYTD